MEAYDLLLDDDGDFLIQNGDLVIGPSNEELLNSLFLSHFNEWKNNPSVGINIENYLNGDITQSLILQQNMRTEMVADGFVVQDLKVDSDLTSINISTNADRQF